MQYVLRNLVCLGLTTNQDFLLKLVEHPDFQAGQYDTHFIENKMSINQSDSENNNTIAFCGIAATLLDWKNREDSRTLLKTIPSGWRNSFYDFQQETYIYNDEEILVKYRFQKDRFLFKINDEEYDVQLITANDYSVRVEIDGVQNHYAIAKIKNEYFIQNAQTGNIYLQQKSRFPDKIAEKAKGGYEAPMPSQIVKVLVENGQQVKPGDGLVVLSSMKMENTISAAENGVVEEIFAEEGGNVEAGFLLLKIKRLLW